ncbi:MAG: hypothetical protein ACR2JP_07110 [Acidimicrobiia bacterium]
MSEPSMSTLIEASDLDGLVALIGRLVAAGDWEGIDDLIRRCDQAVERGKQVWGAREYAEYRIALDAPEERAATVLHVGAGRFAPGPLWEVAASTHTWAELGRHITQSAIAFSVSQERALRGERLPDDAVIIMGTPEVPLRPASWEPRYLVATYREDGVDVPGPELGELAWVDLGDPVEPVDDREACDALLDIVRPWLDESSGRGEAVAVEGDARNAIRALGPHRVRLAPISPQTAIQLMAWAGASGGAYGRRRGTPAGRAAAWWALASLLGIEEAWPVDPDELGEAVGTLRWFAWDPGDQVGGWAYHLAVEDPDEGLAWAVSAVDAM